MSPEYTTTITFNGMSRYVKYRNRLLSALYKGILKPVLFLLDPEDIHDFFVRFGAFLGKFSPIRWKISKLFDYRNEKLRQKILGIDFRNPVGLAAGFDKDIELTDIISSLGFGFEEVGSITAKACDGNPRPRLWRLPKTKSLGVWYGLKNKGAKILSKKLANKIHQLPIGVNIAFTNCKENLDIPSAISDYVAGIQVMEKYADYITVNLSCPNTLGGIPFIMPESYGKLMVEIDKNPTNKPFFVKISPDMTHQEIDKFLEITGRHRVHGIICTNLSKEYDQKEIKDPIPPQGGLSGRVVFPKALDLLSYMYKKVGNKYIFIFCGGIFSADDAYRVIKQGASLIELITGMIFEGPQIVSEINRGLVEKITRDGFKNISEALGVENK